MELLGLMSHGTVNKMPTAGWATTARHPCKPERSHIKQSFRILIFHVELRHFDVWHLFRPKQRKNCTKSNLFILLSDFYIYVRIMTCDFVRCYKRFRTYECEARKLFVCLCITRAKHTKSNNNHTHTLFHLHMKRKLHVGSFLYWRYLIFSLHELFIGVL